MPARRAHRDGPWRRLPWLVPAAALISLAAVAGFLSLLTGAPVPPSPPVPLEVQVVELPPAPAAAPEPPPPEPPPPQAEPDATPPPPLAEPEPPLAEPEPPPPPPRPPPPKPRPPRPAQPAQNPPATSAPAERTTPQPAPTLPTGANTAGARAIYQPLPEIPEALRHHAVELVAIARFRVAANGSAEVELATPTPDPIFNRLLLEALRKWRFFPKIEAGRPVASVIDIRIPISIH